LQEGVKKITEVDKRFANVGVKDRSMIWNTDLVETLELQNLLTCATVPPPPHIGTDIGSKLLFRRLRGRNRVGHMRGKIIRNGMIRIGWDIRFHGNTTMRIQCLWNTDLSLRQLWMRMSASLWYGPRSLPNADSWCFVATVQTYVLGVFCENCSLLFILHIVGIS